MNITTALGEILSAETVERLQAEAEIRQVPITDLVREVIEDYVELLDEEEIEDTPDDEIIADFKEAWHAAMTGNTIPVRQLLEEIRQELQEHGD